MDIKKLKKQEEKAIFEAGKFVLLPIAIVNILLWIALISSPFVLMWHGGDIAWRVAVTGALGAGMTAYIYRMVQNSFKESIMDELKLLHKSARDDKAPNAKKSRFQQRLDDAMEKNREAKRRG